MQCGSSIKPHTNNDTNNGNPYPNSIHKAPGCPPLPRFRIQPILHYFIAREGLVTLDPREITIGIPGYARWSFSIDIRFGGRCLDWLLGILWRLLSQILQFVSSNISVILEKMLFESVFDSVNICIVQPKWITIIFFYVLH